MIELSPERIRELSAQARSNIETKANDKDDTRWWIPDHFDQEFARLIVQELLTVLKPSYSVKQELVEDWFAEEWAQYKALGMLHDYENMLYKEE